MRVLFLFLLLASGSIEAVSGPACWAVLQEGVRSPSYAIRSTALIAAATLNRAEGVELLVKAFSDPYRQMRKLAVQIAQTMHDYPLKHAVLERLQKEQIEEIRLELITAIGSMKLIEGKPFLERILSSQDASLAARERAIQSWILLESVPSQQTVIRLLKSERAEQRVLGCKSAMGRVPVVAYFKDPNVRVRVAALESYGRFSPPKQEEIAPLLNSPDLVTALAASWVAFIHQMHLGEDALICRCLRHTQASVRRFAASVAVAAGKKGIHLTGLLSDDPIVEMNFCWAALCQRKNVKKLGSRLLVLIKKHPVHWKEYMGIPTIQEGERGDGCALKLAQLLLHLEINGAEELIEEELFRPSGPLPWIAAERFLFAVGDRAQVQIKRRMKQGGIQSEIEGNALLSLWGDREALMRLVALYVHCDKRQKQKILEIFGEVADPIAIPLLEKELEAIFSSIQIRAAWALLRIKGEGIPGSFDATPKKPG